MLLRIANALIFMWDLYINSEVSMVKNEDIPLTWISPAPYAFSIWGIIYLSLTLFVMIQFFPITTKKGTVEYKLIQDSISILFCMVCLVNASWLIYWIKFPAGPMSVFFMLYLLVTLGTIYFHFDFVIRDSKHQRSLEERRALLIDELEEDNYYERDDAFSQSIYIWFIKTPFSLYFAWVLVATLVNQFILYAPILPDCPYDTIPLAVAAIISIAVIGLGILIYNKDIYFASVIAWALLAISKSESCSKYPGTASESVSQTCLITCAILVISVGFVSVHQVLLVGKTLSS